jgi:cephalosporin hydroxylase
LKCTVDTETWTITLPDGRTISWFDDEGFRFLSDAWLAASWQRKYSYQFRWFGRPIIQLPHDMVLMQDLIVRIRPTLIIETGIAHGGSAVMHASLLSMIHGGIDRDRQRPHVVAVDIEIRPHNRAALDEHPLRHMMTLIEGSSVAPSTIERVRTAIQSDDRVLVVLDSNHLCDHVRAELEAYAPLVSPGSAIVVMDGVMRDLAGLPNGTPSWREDNPISAIDAFLASPAGRAFTIDSSYDGYACTHSPQGILLRSAGAGAG